MAAYFIKPPSQTLDNVCGRCPMPIYQQSVFGEVTDTVGTQTSVKD